MYVCMYVYITKRPVLVLDSARLLAVADGR